MNIILEYFDIKYYWKNSIPVIKLKLKDNKKVTMIEPNRLNNNMPISPSNVDYFKHYLGDEIGILVYSERKKLFPKNKLIEWYINNFNPTDSDELMKYKNSIGNKVSNSLKIFYSSNTEKCKITKNKLKERNKKWAPIIGKLNSNKWKTDKDWAEKTIKNKIASGVYKKSSITIKNKWKNDSEFAKKMMSLIRSKDRIEKIRKKSVEMWDNVKKTDLEKYYKMINNSKNKKYELNGYKLNSIEYLIAKILNDINVEWDYEKIFSFNEKTYMPDFYIKKYNLIVESYGDFWHANPKFFSEKSTTHKTRTAIDVWKYDLEKKENFEKNGYKYLFFWEYDILENIEEIKEKIKNEIY